MSGTGEFIGQRVGRFTITSHLASGGMAELFIARQEAVGGFEKSLVLKMLQERYAANARVVEMFLTEARLAAKLNHQNIVHVYDVAEANGIRYIAMEYIDGETITDIVRRSIARGGFLPIEHAIHIVGETAAGLAYAHEHRDTDGRPARIVHRDVSPSNILVTYEGLTKIVDFGIARVQDQIREESGMRPGKVSYMSPEQVRGEPTDHRSDIFSLGIILYEITVGRRLWRGPPEVVMRRIVEEQIPPPTYVRREYPPALELIVMKALERRPSDRFKTAADFQNELNEFMDEAGLKSGARRLSQYMKDLFAPDASVSEEGVATSRQFADPGENGEDGDDDGKAAAEDSEELDFDRRAPLVLRMEARSDQVHATDRGPAPVPPLAPAGSASGAAVAKAGGDPRPRLVAVPTPGPAGPGAAATAGAGAGAVTAAAVAAALVPAGDAPDADQSSASMIEFAAAVAAAVARPRASGSFPIATARTGDSPRPTMLEPVGRAAETDGATVVDGAGTAERGPLAEADLTPPRGIGLRWVALALLAVVLVVVFLATR